LEGRLKLEAKLKQIRLLRKRMVTGKPPLHEKPAMLA